MSEPQPGINAINESDTNADTCCLGKNFIVLSYTNRMVDVYSYDTSKEPIADVPMGPQHGIVKLPEKHLSWYSMSHFIMVTGWTIV